MTTDTPQTAISPMSRATKTSAPTLVIQSKRGSVAYSVRETIDAAATRPFEHVEFTPGLDIGGHCVARGSFCLACKPETLKNTARFMELPDQVTSAVLGYSGQRVRDAFNEAGKALEGSGAPVLGMAHMPKTERIGGSPALGCACLLQEKGARMPDHDPYLASLAYGNVA